MSIPSCQTVMAYELKRYMMAMEEASDTIAQDPSHSDHVDRVKTIHALVKILSSLFWEDCLVNGIEEVIKLHRIEEPEHKLVKNIEQRSQFETYTASLRAFLKSSVSSYILKTLLSQYALEELQGYGDIVIRQVGEVLKHIDTVLTGLEDYLTWLEYGADLAAKFINYIESDTEDISASDLYTDTRTKAYAMLRVSQLSPAKMAAHIEGISDLLMAINDLIKIIYDLYISMAPETFERIFHMITSKTIKTSERHNAFSNIHELNEYFRQRVTESVDAPDGLLYNISELLEETRTSYLDKLTTEIVEALIFFPTKADQEKYVRQFESGKIWLRESLELS